MPKAYVKKGLVKSLAAAERARAKDSKSKTQDSFQNFAANLGIGTNNVSSAGTYGFNPITRVRTLLEWIHRGSWLGGVAIDIVADDMTKRGVDLKGDLTPEDIDHLERAAVSLNLWPDINDCVKWSRLYGGCLNVLMIQGQDPKTPLRPETIGPGQFKGLLTLDRWQVEPSLQELVDEMGPHFGLPKFYRVNSDSSVMRNMTVHYSRCLRLEGIRLPYWQRVMENMWGISVIERLYDRMIAFDSATQGAAQLVYKSYIRTYAIDNLRQIVSAGGPAERGLVKYVQMMAAFQGIEGVTLMDAKDRMEEKVGAGTGARGMADLLLSFGEQIAGSLQIPLVRLFGQSPRGLSATGESDLRTYYDGILMRQNRDLKSMVTLIYRILAQSEGIKLSEGFGIEFRPLWIMNDIEKAQTAGAIAAAVAQADSIGAITKEAAMKELRQSSRITGIFSNITDEDIEMAAQAPPPGAAEAMMLEQQQLGMAGQEQQMEHAERNQQMAEEQPQNGAGKKKAAKDAEHIHYAVKRRNGYYCRDCGIKFGPRTKGKIRQVADSVLGDRKVMGFNVVVEHEKGDTRYGSVLPAAYGYIRKTSSAEGRWEQMDCFIGPDLADGLIFIIDAYDNETGKFLEHKVMFGFPDKEAALADFRAYYGNMPKRELIGKTQNPISPSALATWLSTGDVTRPHYPPTDVEYVSVAEPGGERCINCQYFDAGICSNHSVHHDPKVPETYDGLKQVASSGWCKEYVQLKVTA